MKQIGQLPSRQLVSQNDSSIIQRANIPRSVFRGSWTRTTAFDAGYLVPILVDEILPGDHMTYDITAYVRMSTPLFPIFHNQRIDTFFFFVPNRIMWTNWVKMMGQQASPGDSIDYTTPQVGGTGGVATGSLGDHLGLPFVAGNINSASVWSVNSLPFRAYNRIFNAWFRDENLVTAQSENTGDGPDVLTQYVLKRRAKSHDYFTSALPWPQKFTAPNVPILGSAPISGLGKADLSPGGGGAVGVYQTDLTNPIYGNASNLSDNAAGNLTWMRTKQDPNNPALIYPDVYADLTQATGVAINTFRQAFMIQTLLERDARGGTRYTELLLSHFGVRNPDYRLQRPEYIGGGSTPLQLTPIAQTAPTAGVPLGALGAAGTAAGQHRASYAATEHGFIIGLINVRSEISYQQGLHKMWSRRTRYDHYWPALAGLGEQAILRKEIYAQGDFAPGSDDAIFGYQERWHEYRTRMSEVTGIMRSNATGTLDAWHLSQNFTGNPAINATFIEDNPPMTRVLAGGSATTNQQYIADILYRRTAVRPIPTFGTPVTLGRF